MTGDSTFPAQPARPAVAAPAAGGAGAPAGGQSGFRGRPAVPAQPARPGNVDYEAQLRVKASGGKVHANGDHLVVEGANDVTLVLVAATSYTLDWDKKFRGDSPHTLAVQHMKAASARSFDELKQAHVTDYQKYFHRVNFDIPTTAASAEPTDLRLQNYKDGANDPSLAMLYYQMGRYLLISSSRPDNPLPSNSQGIWATAWTCRGSPTTNPTSTTR